MLDAQSQFATILAGYLGLGFDEDTALALAIADPKNPYTGTGIEQGVPEDTFTRMGKAIGVPMAISSLRTNEG